MVVYGIRNVGNSCYASSVIQCLRRCLKDHRLSLINITLKVDGLCHDAHEYYMKLIESLPESISKLFLTKHESDVYTSYLSLTQREGTIITPPEILCVYYQPKMVYLDDLSICEIDMGDHICQYHLVACICYHKDIQHYTSVVLDDDRWYHCDDHVVTLAASRRHPIYMGFYMRY